VNPEGLRVLAERADDVRGRPDARLDEVHARIGHLRRRRQVSAVVAAVVAVVVALSAGLGLLSLTRTDETPPARPAPRPTSTPTVLVEKGPGVRRLTYATGHEVHWGGRTVDVGGTVWNVQSIDGGALFTRSTRDCFRDTVGCNELWFTDGSQVVHIGTVYGSVIRGFALEKSSSGSTAVWFEPSPADHPHGSGYEYTGEWVVYDVHARREVARLGTPGRDTDSNGHPHLVIEAVFDDYVYWTPDDRARAWCRDYTTYSEQCRRHTRVMRLDTATGTQVAVPWASYVADRGSRPRMFFPARYLPVATDNGFPSEHPGQETVDLHREGGRFVADYDGGRGQVTVRLEGRPQPLRLRPPRGFVNDTNLYWITGWLDDQHVVVRADNREELAVCRLPDGPCRIAVRHAPIMDFGGRG
jgi:hypothetical protein